jgi:drug/metabolite transporter (DMT)-like permease
MKKLFEKHVIVQYIVRSFVKTLLIALGAFAVLFAILEFTGLYEGIERVLDLKYNSPFILIPLWGFIALAVLCFIIGFLMYFYKYIRAKSKSTFHSAFSTILEKK